ncbi:LruC domain-containing protein [Marinigracilibium pacificum]|uniref:LruC domain-containing protein n=1 Tax=Marinigracilibium pacificum TaxID=2729599 RepID=A0A848IXU1_9BACT|nr:LruC domain-containing protein [Marinigracilibium pacificum]NMM48141.1 LruC domain-containing protein [Marinigracilibium pacificum]
MKTHKSKLGFLSLMMIGLSIVILQSCSDGEQVKPLKGKQNAGKSMNYDLMDYEVDAPAACKEVCLVAGQHMLAGTVQVAYEGGNLYVTYNVTQPGVYLEEIHLDLFNSVEEFKAAKKISGGGAIPGKFEFKKSWSAESMVTSYTAVIPSSYVDMFGDCFFVATHAALSNGETAWGGVCDESDKGVTLDGAKQFPGANWGVFFEFCKEECEDPTIDFTYAWEDLLDNANDADYNDLVVQSAIIRTASELKITLFAAARGASLDHSFRFMIPAQGVVSILGAYDYELVGDKYMVTVFENTTDAIPGDPFANTVSADGCYPGASMMITISTDDTFNFNPAAPYDPFLRVYNWGYEAAPDVFYDLYIWELPGNQHAANTWIASNGKEYPNGILIPFDWKWPEEGQMIMGPYADFMSITDGWNPNWADNLTDVNLTFDRTVCGL